ncbi:MAG TPA: hypothetical protein VF820_06095 [Patescibacteria group bacterium]
MTETPITTESTHSPDFRPWGTEFPTREAFTAYTLERLAQEQQTPPSPRIKPEDLSTITALDIAKFWDIDWQHVVNSSRSTKPYGNEHAAIDYLYNMLDVMRTPNHPQRDNIVNDSFLLKPTGEVYNGTHRAAALILIGPQYIQAHGLTNIVVPSVIH